MHHGARVCILTLCVRACVYTPPWEDISSIHLHNKVHMPRLKVEVWVQVGLLTSVLLISARRCSPFWSSGLQKQTSRVVYPFMQVFAVLPGAVALPQNSKANLQKGSWHRNNSPCFHQSSCGSISWVFILSGCFSSFLIFFFSYYLSSRSSLCFHPFSTTNFSCNCKKTKLSGWLSVALLYLGFKTNKWRTFLGMTEHWNLYCRMLWRPMVYRHSKRD